VERDWCVSRQLWWGHRIPAYYPVVAGGRDQGVKEGEGPPQRLGSEYIVARSEEEALKRARYSPIMISAFE
jgi:valyl-tRNA synthetase